MKWTLFMEYDIIIDIVLLRSFLINLSFENVLSAFVRVTSNVRNK